MGIPCRVYAITGEVDVEEQNEVIEASRSEFGHRVRHRISSEVSPSININDIETSSISRANGTLRMIIRETEEEALLS